MNQTTTLIMKQR